MQYHDVPHHMVAGMDADERDAFELGWDAARSFWSAWREVPVVRLTEEAVESGEIESDVAHHFADGALRFKRRIARIGPGL